MFRERRAVVPTLTPSERGNTAAGESMLRLLPEEQQDLSRVLREEFRRAVLHSLRADTGHAARRQIRNRSGEPEIDSSRTGILLIREYREPIHVRERLKNSAPGTRTPLSL